MKKSNKFRRPATLVASFAVVCIMGVSIMQSSFAQDLVEKIVQKVSLGHITVTQTESSQTDTLPMPDDLKGKIFDKDGKEIKELNKEKNQKYYTADGEEIVGIGNGEIITASQQEKMNQEDESYNLVIKDPNEFNKYTCFNVLLPTYLPKGYELDKGEFYKDEKGNVSKKYIDLYFTNKKTGKYISMQQRFADEETAYETGTDGKIEKVKMNGVDAVISDDRYIDWEMNNVLYRLSGRGEITKDELIKIAESMK
ncbi:DUF4367 domain-containing protein [Inediibacterium massiliense]|uniref:DUF4367 domain-containing protein n=1 Tax=Inediibacterium massiliense TaxID=1658111 RepID=UPI0006B54E6E|nr:DUF4367 domain-containing protein [Inediibacterium massiliense]